jgi:catechol 2,3-dioxygenase-like lactoylglutathione lyase family enzyme
MFPRLIMDVADIERSLAFYAGLLRMPVRQEEAWEGHRIAYLATGPTEILLVEQPKADQPQERAGGQVINLRVRELHALSCRLAQHRVHVLQPFDDALFGERTLLVADPDGYPVLLSEPAETLN